MYNYWITAIFIDMMVSCFSITHCSKLRNAITDNILPYYNNAILAYAGVPKYRIQNKLAG